MKRERCAHAYLLRTLMVLATVLLATLVFSEFSRPHVLEISADAPGYLLPSISSLSGHGFGHTYARGFVYPLLVYGSILASGDLSGVMHIQLAMYWLMLVMLISLMWIRTDPIPRSQRSIGGILLSALISLAAALTYLSYSPTLISAYSLGPELLFAFLALASSVALICAFAQRKHGGVLFVVTMIFSIFAAMANVLVKPQWIFGAAFISLLWIGVLAISSLRIGAKIAILFFITFLNVFALALPEWHLIKKYDPAATLFGPKTLFCNHADIIVRAAQNQPELWRHFPADFSRPVLDSLEAVVAQADGWPLLGFNSDLCMYGEPVARPVQTFYANDIPSMRSFYTTMFIDSVAAEPLLYLRKVIAQMAYATLRPYWNAGLTVHATDRVAREFISAHNEYAGLFSVAMDGAISGTLALYLPRIDQFMTRLTIRLLGPIALLAISAALLAWLLIRIKGLPICATPAFAIAALAGAWLGQSLTVALSHTFDVGRYFWAGVPLIIAATFLSLSLLIQIFLLVRPRFSRFAKP